MLTHLSIHNLAIVKRLDIDFHQGMTAITGETGAGKSIAIDALGLCLGERADATMVRSGAEKAEVTASFCVEHLPQARQWLQEQDLEDEFDCIIRRVLSAEGRSKAYVNGTPVSLQQLKNLGQLLISIHGQHAHQQLLKAENQRQLLDAYAEHPKLLNTVSHDYQALRSAQKHYQQLQASQQQREDRRQLLSYQVEELDEFALQENEFAELEVEHKRLSHSQTLLEQAQRSFYMLYDADEFNALAAIQQSLDSLSELQEHDAALTPIVNLLNEACIQVEEAAHELRSYAEDMDIDPFRLQQVEARYSKTLELARKHGVAPEELAKHHLQLVEEFNGLQQDDEALANLQQQLEQLEQTYYQSAEALSLSRQKSAKRLAKEIETQIRKLNMAHAVMNIEVVFEAEQTPNRSGLDQIRFKVATNPGQAADALEKVASGGELSRIGLAIQVISSSRLKVPTMIFDEVDTGISGPTAAVVGQLLRQLGQNNQVMCVTHLPQVAAQGHQQMFVTKFSDKHSTETHMICLSENERINELARLLAGDKLTESAIANAKELLYQHAG